MATNVRYPDGQVWPAEMRTDMAAAYVDEPSVEAFNRKVGSVYPLPVRGKGEARKWSKAELDKAIADRHGKGQKSEDISGLI